MKHSIKIVSVALIFLSSFSFAALFNRVNTQINTPTALMSRMGTLEFGACYGTYNLPSGIYWEDDYFMNYSLTDFFRFGITRLNNTTIVGNLNMLVYRNFLYDDVDLAVGADNITDKKILSTFDSINEKYESNMSLYGVMSIKRAKFDINLGIGEGRFYNNTSPKDWIGLFGSIGYGFDFGRLVLEYDGRDYNIGFKFSPSEILDINMALTQLPLRSGNNGAYGDVPYSNFTIGFSFKQNLFDFYKKEYDNFYDRVGSVKNLTYENESRLVNIKKMEKELTDSMVTLRKEKEQLLQSIQAMKDFVATDAIKKEQILQTDVLQYYYDGLRYYYAKQYYAAIESLTKSILINPNVPTPYVRLGSIYWDLGLKKEALDNWQKGLNLDPMNEELRKFIHDNPSLKIDSFGIIKIIVE